MDKLDLILPPELETSLDRFYSAPEPDATFASRLELELRRRQMDLLKPTQKPRFPLWTKRNSFMQTLRARPVLMILFILLALGLLTGVVYAVSRSLGYIPGVGLVDQQYGIRVLSEPVSAGKDQIKVTVTKVIADASQTFVTYRVDGIPVPTVQDGWPICTETPALQLPDGRKLDSRGGKNGGFESYGGKPISIEPSYTFPAIPPGVKTVTFLAPCNQPEITLQLVPAPAGFATPAKEIEPTFEASGPKSIKATNTPLSSSAGATETIASTPALGPTPFQPTIPTYTPGDSGLSLIKVIVLKDSYVLIGSFTNKGELPGAVVGLPGDLPYRTEIIDRQGKSIDFDLRSDLVQEPNGNSIGWAYEISKLVQGPIKVTLSSVPLLINDQIKIPLDAGSNPQPDQKWEMNRTVNLGGSDYVIDDITARENGYTIHFHSGFDVPDEMSFNFNIFPSENLGGSGILDHRKDKMVYEETILFDGPLPAGKITFLLTLNYRVLLPGPWTLTWSPPAGK